MNPTREISDAYHFLGLGMKTLVLKNNVCVCVCLCVCACVCVPEILHRFVEVNVNESTSVEKQSTMDP